MTNFKVYKDRYVQKVDSHGKRILAVKFFDMILVHPDNWDEFILTINHPDMAKDPEVREILGFPPLEEGNEGNETEE